MKQNNISFDDFCIQRGYIEIIDGQKYWNLETAPLSLEEIESEFNSLS